MGRENGNSNQEPKPLKQKVSAPHHRLKMSYSDSVFGYSEGAEHNFYPAEFWQVWEGDILRANQATREGAEHYMAPGRILVGPGGVRP